MYKVIGNFFNTELLNQIRKCFANVDYDPIGGKRIYFENAGGSLTLKSVIDKVKQFTALPDNAGRNNATSHEIDCVINQGIEDIKQFMGVKFGVVALGESTTNNVFRTLAPIIRSVKGKNVVTTDIDHPSVYDSTKLLCDRYGKEWRTVPLNPRTGIVDVNEVLKRVDSETIVLAIIHSSNNLGTRNNLKGIVKKVREIRPDLYVLVDGSQYCMHSVIDVEAIGCDVYLVSSYKTFNKPGAAVVYLSERASHLPHDKLAGKPDNYWEQGTREVAGYAGWSEVINYLCWLGGHFIQSGNKRELICAAMNAIDKHERALLNRMLNGTDEIRGMLNIESMIIYGEVENLTTKDAALLFNVEGFAPADIVCKLNDRGVRVHDRLNDCYSGHTLRALDIEAGVRISAAHYNTPEEVDFFLKVVHEIIR